MALTVLALGGCSFEFSVGLEKEMTKESLEREIAGVLEQQAGQRPDSIDCPSGAKAEVGESIRCVLTAGQDRFGLTATVTGVDGDKVDMDIQVDNTTMN